MVDRQKKRNFLFFGGSFQLFYKDYVGGTYHTVAQFLKFGFLFVIYFLLLTLKNTFLVSDIFIRSRKVRPTLKLVTNTGKAVVNSSVYEYFEEIHLLKDCSRVGGL